MWQAHSMEMPSGRRVHILEDDAPISFRQLFSLLDSDAEFREWYSRTLIDRTFDAFFWEHPPFTVKTFDNGAEFVLLNAAALAGISASPAPFEVEFSIQSSKDVLVFPNLGGDALLIVPRPIGKLEAYPHLAAFLRSAPANQVHTLWQTVAKAVRGQLSAEPRWLSTAGLGVSWLHVRLDTWPKYYRFEPYKVAER